MKGFHEFSLKIPNGMFGISMSNKSSGSSTKEKKENIILQLPTDLKTLTEMQ
jgi:hypothetical protein